VDFGKRTLEQIFCKSRQSKSLNGVTSFKDCYSSQPKRISLFNLIGLTVRPSMLSRFCIMYCHNCHG